MRLPSPSGVRAIVARSGPGVAWYRSVPSAATLGICKRYRYCMRSAPAAVGVCVLGLFCLACAPHQWVPIDVKPRTATIFLDGEPLENPPEELRLRSDRDHTFLVKSPGHRGELVVLRSVERRGDPVLEPDGVWVRLAPTGGRGRELIIEPVPGS